MALTAERAEKAIRLAIERELSQGKLGPAPSGSYWLVGVRILGADTYRSLAEVKSLDWLIREGRFTREVYEEALAKARGPLVFALCWEGDASAEAIVDLPADPHSN